jgi:hypothetical protein
MSVVEEARMARSRNALAAVAVSALFTVPAAAQQKESACTKIEICYCYNTAVKATIDKNVAFFRAEIAKQRAAGKAIGYLSLPLSSAGGGVYHINAEVSAAAKAAVEKRFGADHVWVSNPAVPESDIPNGGGADYMLMWTQIMEGEDGLGAFDFAYFVGPSDFGRFLGLDGVGDMARIEAYFVKRVATDPELKKSVEKGLTIQQFRNYYALRASATISRGAHDEWNIIKVLNEKRRADPKLGIPNQISVLFDGQGRSPADMEGGTSNGYTGKCTP